jgi:hypothetical protein
MAYSRRRYITTSLDRFQRRLVRTMLRSNVPVLQDTNQVVLGVRMANQCYKCWLQWCAMHRLKKRFNGWDWCDGITHV